MIPNFTSVLAIATNLNQGITTHSYSCSASRQTSDEDRWQLELLFRRLNLAHTRRIYQEVADRAEKENWSYRDFLALLLAEEAHRKQTRLQRFTRKAHFPGFASLGTIS
jgi:IstB-like ATP binding protein